MAFAAAHINHALPFIGFKVKNTFIDDVEPLECDMCDMPEQPSVLRCVTEPVPQSKSLEFEMDDDCASSTATGSSTWDEGTPSTVCATPTQQDMPCWLRTTSGHDLLHFCERKDGKVEELEVEGTWEGSSHVGGGAASTQRWPRTMSGDDLADFLSSLGSSPSSDDSCTTRAHDSEIELIPDLVASEVGQPELASMVQRALMVQQYFTSLRVTSSTLMPLVSRSAKSKRTAPSSVTRCLRVCVEGLPAMKRNKWTQPFALEVAGVLECMECPAMVRRGELFASLDATAGGEMVFVDLCAPRKSDQE